MNKTNKMLISNNENMLQRVDIQEDDIVMEFTFTKEKGCYVKTDLGEYYTYIELWGYSYVNLIITKKIKRSNYIKRLFFGEFYYKFVHEYSNHPLLKRVSHFSPENYKEFISKGIEEYEKKERAWNNIYKIQEELSKKSQ